MSAGLTIPGLTHNTRTRLTLQHFVCTVLVTRQTLIEARREGFR